MKKIIALMSLFALSVGFAFAQQVEVEKPSLVQVGVIPLNSLKEKKPIPYPRSNISDIVWARKVWRVFDLREKINYPLYYPTIIMQTRKSLVQALVGAVYDGQIKAYDVNDDDFTTELSIEELKGRFDATDQVITRPKMDGSGDTTIVIRGDFNWAEIQELLIKEEWFFDKHHGQMFVRVLGICPVRVYNRSISSAAEEEEDFDFALGERVKRKLFWAYYPETRPLLVNTPCFISENEVSQTSFDDMFEKRRFNSYIISVSNPQNNRQVDQYTHNDFEKMLESERLKRELFNFEHDLWEY